VCCLNAHAHPPKNADKSRKLILNLESDPLVEPNTRSTRVKPNFSLLELDRVKGALQLLSNRSK